MSSSKNNEDSDDGEPVVEDLTDEEPDTGIRDYPTVLRHRNPIQLPHVSSSTSSSSSSDNATSDSIRDGNNNPAAGAAIAAVVDTDVKKTAPVTVAADQRRDEYISCLSHWNKRVNDWHTYQQTLSATILTSSLIAASTLLPAATATPAAVPAADPNDRRSGRTQGTTAAAAVTGVTSVPELRLYRIPKLWKRLTAEMIDFLFLLVIKIIVTFIAIEYFDVIDLTKFDFTLLESIDAGDETSFGEDLDAALSDAYRLAFELTSEILVIESMHRIIVIVYETLFLMRSFFQRRRPTGGRMVPVATGGATPGKFLMGLRVVSCFTVSEFVAENGDCFVQVSPGREIGFGWSLLRAMVKNFSSVFFLPASLTVLVSRHNRAAYDIVCRSQVVEE